MFDEEYGFEGNYELLLCSGKSRLDYICSSTIYSRDSEMFFFFHAHHLAAIASAKRKGMLENDRLMFSIFLTPRFFFAQSITLEDVHIFSIPLLQFFFSSNAYIPHV